ncbi:MAG TPA: carboxypeptidase-like regulatory domain-containing protein [Tangfeifania sp.]|nr:carboxypeptidase-like regulatory domain-containing protein [Tangfeifania sp.]
MKTILNIFILFTVFIVPEYGQAQLLSVSGYVKNFVSDKVLENVSVYENESGIGTISNSDGYYKLLLKPGTRNLKLSSHGFEDFPMKFELKGDTIITVRLKPNNYKQPELADGKVISGKKEILQKKANPNK